MWDRPLLLVKTSSMGDLLHTLPALTDAWQRWPEIRFHWLVEEAFGDIPGWHPAVARVIPLPWRRWRKNPWQAWQQGELRRFYHTLREGEYDRIIDLQGLLKSAVPARLGRGPVWGLDGGSARESLAALFYHHRVTVNPAQHAILRNRLLMAQALGYALLPPSSVEYGLDRLVLRKGRTVRSSGEAAFFVFLHSTTWASKHWPESYWQRLIRLAAEAGDIVLPWGNEAERERARRLSRVAPGRCRVADRMGLTTLAHLLARAAGVVSVDTGPAHLAAAVGTPAVCLYGPTDPAQIGTVAANHRHLTGLCPHAPCKKRACPRPSNGPIHPPCFEAISPEMVWQTLLNLVDIPQFYV